MDNSLFVDGIDTSGYLLDDVLSTAFIHSQLLIKLMHAVIEKVTAACILRHDVGQPE